LFQFPLIFIVRDSSVVVVAAAADAVAAMTMMAFVCSLRQNAYALYTRYRSIYISQPAGLSTSSILGSFRALFTTFTIYPARNSVYGIH